MRPHEGTPAQASGLSKYSYGSLRRDLRPMRYGRALRIADAHVRRKREAPSRETATARCAHAAIGPAAVMLRLRAAVR